MNYEKSLAVLWYHQRVEFVLEESFLDLIFWKCHVWVKSSFNTFLLEIWLMGLGNLPILSVLVFKLANIQNEKRPPGVWIIISVKCQNCAVFQVCLRYPSYKFYWHCYILFMKCLSPKCLEHSICVIKILGI